MPRRKLLTRRRFLKLTAGASLVGAGTFLYTWRVEPHWVEIVRRDLPVKNLSEALVGKTLVQISDLHIGPVVDDDYMSEALARVSALRPDILAITGDLMTCRANEQVGHVMHILQHLQPARIATLAVPGNHDYGHGWRQTATAAELFQRLDERGIRVLRNESIDIEGLQIVGLDDLWSRRFAPERILPTLQRDAPAIVLCHNPDAADRPVWSSYQGWILCGHTHGGQCKAPFFRPPLIPVRNKRYTAGEVDLHDGRKLYINRGLGYLRRVRFNARPEITQFTLQRVA